MARRKTECNIKKKCNLIKGTRTCRNLGLIPSHCRRCTDSMHLDSRLLLLAANGSANSECSEQHPLPAQPSPAPPTPELSSSLWVLQRQLADMSQTWCITALSKFEAIINRRHKIDLTGVSVTPALSHLPAPAALCHAALPTTPGCKAEFNDQMQNALLHTKVNKLHRIL